MKSQQEWVKDIIFSIISLMKTNDYNGDIATEGYKYTINGAVDNYSQTYWDQDKQKNISMFHRYNKFGVRFYRNILMSQNAYKCMLEFSKEEPNMDKQTKKDAIKLMNKKLHGEHLTPQAFTRHKLNELLKESLTDDELMDRIQYAFSDAKLCIITKNESDILDGKGKVFSEEDINAFLEEYKALHTDMSKQMQDDFLALKGLRMKSNGFGSIRLYILMKNKVRFVNDTGDEKSFKDCLDYLEDGNYIL